jgi:uncharacterized membrane protein YqhA
MNAIQSVNPRARSLVVLGNFIFLSRWLQAPLYVGLIVAQGVYVYHFLNELWQLLLHLTFVLSALLLALTDRVSTQSAADARAVRHQNSRGSSADGDILAPSSGRR